MLASPRIPLPTFAELRKAYVRVHSGSELIAFDYGPRWVRINLDRSRTHQVMTRHWPAGPSRDAMAELARIMGRLFVYSHRDGTCFVSGFDTDLVSLMAPRAAADLLIATMVLAELGDTTLVDWILPDAREAFEMLMAERTTTARRQIAGRLTDELAERMLHVTHWQPTTPTPTLRGDHRATP